jgi:flagellar hook-length control protein FliK
MSAFALNIGALPIGAPMSGAKAGRESESGERPTQDFDATLAESARDATSRRGNSLPSEARANDADAKPASTGADALVNGLIHLSAASKPDATATTPPKTGIAVAPAPGSGAATPVPGAKGDDLAQGLRGFRSTGTLPSGAAATAIRREGTIGAKAKSAPLPAEPRESAPEKTPALRSPATSSQDGDATPKAAARQATKTEEKATPKHSAAPTAPAHVNRDAAPTAAGAAATLAAAMSAISPRSGAASATAAQGVAEGGAGAARVRAGAVSGREAAPEAPLVAGPDHADPATIGRNADGALTAVHVVDLKSWLPPTAAANASPTAGPASTIPAHVEMAKAVAPPDPKAVASLSSTASAPSASPSPPASAASQAGALAALSSALQLQPSSDGVVSRGASTVAAPGAASASSAPPASASAPRRDVELTLEPKDLGGLAVRMRSTGDRLEIVFVADRSDTARLIDDKSAGLASQLRGAGLGSGGVDISVAAKPTTTPSGGLATAGGQSFGASQSGAGGQQGAAQPRSGPMRQSREGSNEKLGGAADDSHSARDDRGLYL